jgi:hypothetical protein
LREHVFVSVVIYLRNEREAAVKLIRALDEYLSEHFEMAEIVIVDDASADGAGAAIAEMADSIRHPLVLIELARHCGPDTAMLAGLQQAMGDFVFELETCQPDFELDVLARLYETAAEGTDIVGASGESARLRSRLFYALINRYGNLGVPMSSERVRVVSRRALNAMLALQERVHYRKVLYAITGYPYGKLSYPPLPGRQAPSPSGERSVADAMNILISYSNFGPRAGLSLALLFGVFSLAAAIYTVGVFLFYRNVVSGWTTLMMLGSMGFCGVFLVLGLMGTYVSNVLAEVRRRPPFAVRQMAVFNPLSRHWSSDTSTEADLAVGAYMRSQVEDGELSWGQSGR